MASGTVISYPIPAYSNVSIQAQFYKPRNYVISSITLGQTTTITTTVALDYVVGQLIRLLIPASFGTYQLNNRQGIVLSVPAANQVVVSIDSTQADAFKSSTATTLPQILAIGDINSGAINTSGRVNNLTYIPGSFINISPQ